jgi:L-fuculose-phosphate aldolase
MIIWENTALSLTVGFEPWKILRRIEGPVYARMSGMILTGLKRDLVKASKKLFDAGLVLPGEGNLSMRIPGADAMIITPTANRYRDLEPEYLAVVGFDGNVDEARSGLRPPSSEFRIHAALYKQRPRVEAVVHAHPPEAVSHAVLGMEIPIIVEETAILLGGSVPCAAYRRTGTDDLVLSILEALGTGNAVLLANHGLLTCGRTLTDAVDSILVVEKLAAIHRRARGMTDRPIPPISEADVQVLSAAFRERFSTD